MKKTVLGALALAAFGALLFVLSPSAGAGLPSEPLPTVSGGAPVSLAACPTRRCLTVYVAPWCGYCRASSPRLVLLKRYLEQRQVAMRMVVGMDAPQSVAAYGRELGPETVLDAGGAVRVEGGVPHFYVSDGSGRILMEKAGVPQGGIGDLGEFAAGFDLP